jgi:nucleotide-binding universal stress UspA family protein
VYFPFLQNKTLPEYNSIVVLFTFKKKKQNKMAHSGTVDLTAPDAVAHNKLPFLSGKSQWLVCVDGSPSSWLAVDHAIRLTDPVNDNILLLYIIPRNKLETLDASCFQEAEACLKRSAEAIKEADPHFLVYKSILHRKDIRKAIIKFAVERQVDYIVLGSRGLSPASSLLMGSVSQYVTEHAPCPVVVVREKTKSGGMIVDRSAVAPEKTKKKKKWFFFGSDDSSSSSSSSSSPSVAAPAAAAATVEASDKAVDAAAAQAKSDDQLRALVEGEAPRESDAAEAEQVERLQALAEEHRAARQSELAQQQNDGSVGRVEQEIDNILQGGEGSADASTADLKPAQIDSIEISSKLPRSAPPTLSIQSLHDSSISPVKRAMLNIPISFCFPPIHVCSCAQTRDWTHHGLL